MVLSVMRFGYCGYVVKISAGRRGASAWMTPDHVGPTIDNFRDVQQRGTSTGRET
jgi:hypothetical protein